MIDLQGIGTAPGLHSLAVTDVHVAAVAHRHRRYPGLVRCYRVYFSIGENQVGRRGLRKRRNGRQYTGHQPREARPDRAGIDHGCIWL